jgi:succinate dehydrogenase / fumarate reductase cytochrome b subunit
VNKQRPQTRPINLNLLTMYFPLPAIISILHRVSGVILFLLIPVMLWALEQSLSSEVGYRLMNQHVNSPLGKFFLWAFLLPFLFHLVAGIRHLLMDMNVGVENKSGKLASMVVAIVAGILFILAGIYVW